MKKVILVIALAAAAASIVTANAAAKGPSEASVEGPSLDHAIVFGGSGEGPGSPLGDLTDGAGFFPAVFGQSPDPMLPGRPAGDLGPEYTITYTVPGPNGAKDEIRQTLYPYAKRAPVTYMPAGQQIFGGGETTRGGWYAADTSLKDTLVEAGLPRTAPVVSGSSTSTVRTWPWVLGGIAVVLLLAAASVLLVRRHRPEAA